MGSGKRLVSVLLPVFNCERYLEVAIQSVLDQTFTDFELVVVNDGSTDRSSEILEEFERMDDRITSIHQKNRGLPAALNAGLNICSGKYVARMDGDDILYAHRFECQVAFMERHDQISICGTGVKLIDPVGRPLVIAIPEEEHEAIDEQLLSGFASAIYHPTAMIRHQFLCDIGGYDETSELEDLDLFLRIGEKGRLANLRDVLLDYRLHFTSTNHTRLERHARLTRETVTRAYRRRGFAGTRPIPRRPDRLNSPAAVYADWSCKAFNGGFLRTGLIHLANCLRTGWKSRQGWRLARRTMGLALSLFLNRSKSGGSLQPTGNG